MKKRRKAKKKPFMFLILIIILGIGGYLLYNKILGNNKTEVRYIKVSV